MEKASFAGYVELTDHELEELREKAIIMNPLEFKQLKQQLKREIEKGDVGQLMTAVYGVATSGRLWGKTLKTALEELG